MTVEERLTQICSKRVFIENLSWYVHIASMRYDLKFTRSRGGVRCTNHSIAELDESLDDILIDIVDIYSLLDLWELVQQVELDLGDGVEIGEAITPERTREVSSRLFHEYIKLPEYGTGWGWIAVENISPTKWDSIKSLAGECRRIKKMLDT